MQSLGLKVVLNQLDIYTPYGRDNLRSIHPYNQHQKQELQRCLNDLEAAVLWVKENPKVYEKIIYDFKRLKDIRNTIEQLNRQCILDDIELYEIKIFSYYCECIRQKLWNTNFPIKRLMLSSFQVVLSILSDKNDISPTFSLYDSYSQALKEIRVKKRVIESKIVLAKSEERKKLLEDRIQIVAMEQEEERIVRLQLTHKISEHVRLFDEAVKTIAELDLLLAKSKLVIDEGLVKPILHDGDCMVIESLIHPIVSNELKNIGETFTPVSLSITSGTTIITGPNMGGKSVALRTIGLNVLLAHLGFYIYGKSLSTPIFDFINLLSSGYEIKSGLSTFGQEIVELKDLLEHLETGRGLLLIDEFASGTNPLEGRALSKALANCLHKEPTFSIMVTHFNQVGSAQMDHYQIKGLKPPEKDDTKFGIEGIKARMDYRLERVKDINQVPKEAVTIASLLGLKEDIINEARNIIDKEVSSHGEKT